MLLFVLACAPDGPADNHAASLDTATDTDNWIEGSFVDEFQPDVTDVTISLRNTGAGITTELTYGTGVLYLLDWAPFAADYDQQDYVRSVITSDLVAVRSIETLDIEWYWNKEHTEVTGTFESEFYGFEDDTYYANGGFKGEPQTAGYIP
jgi:hypothetical protein